MHQGEKAIGIVTDVRDWKVEIPVAIRADVLKGFDLDGNGEQGSKSAQIEVNCTIDDWTRNRRRSAGCGLKADREQVLGDRSELRGGELTSPIRAVRRIKASERVQHSLGDSIKRNGLRSPEPAGATSYAEPAPPAVRKSAGRENRQAR